MYGKTVDLHPAVILMVLPAGAAVAGIFGLFAAIPVTAFLASVSGAVVNVLSEEAPEQRRSGRADGEPEIPIWLDRLGQWSVRLLLAAAMGGVVVFALGAVPLVIATATIGIILAATFRPAVSALERRGWRKGRAALAVTVGAWGISIVVVVVSLASLLANAPELVDTTTGGATSISDTDWVKTLAGQVGTGLFSTLTALAQGIAGLAVTMLLGALLMFYLLRDGSKGWASVTRRFSGWRGETVDVAGQKADVRPERIHGLDRRTGGIRRRISQAIIMWLLGLPLILPIAMLSFILGFIPYIGGAIGTLLAFLVAVKVGTTQDIIIMGVWTIVFNIVQGSFIAPIVYGKAVSLHPAIVLIAIPAGGQLAGIMGMFLAVPILGIVAAIWRLIIGAMSDRQHALALQGATRPPELDHPPDPEAHPSRGPCRLGSEPRHSGRDVPVERDGLGGERRLAQDEVGGLLGQHHDRRVDVAVGHVRHRGRIHHPEPVDTVDPHRQRIDDRVAIDAHPGRTRRMERGLGVAPHPVEDLIVGGHGRAGRRLAAVVRIHGVLSEDVPGDADRLHPLAPILVRGQVVEAQGRMDPRVRARELERAARVRVHRPDMDLVAMAGRSGTAVVADGQRQEVEHQVRVRHILVAAHESATFEVVGGTRSTAQEQPLRSDEGAAPLLGRRWLHGDRLRAGVLDVDLEVVLQVCANPREIADHRDPERLEV